jgi:hypothetical protein
MPAERIVAAGFAIPLPAMSGAEPWAAWKAVCVPNVCGGREAEPADRACAQVGEDVAEHVFRDEDVECRGPLYQI